MNKDMLDLNESILTMIHEYVNNNANRYSKPSFEEDIHDIFLIILLFSFILKIYGQK